MMLATIHPPLVEAMRHLIVLSVVLVSLGIAEAVHAGECVKKSHKGCDF
jgi:hypothetical protein